MLRKQFEADLIAASIGKLFSSGPDQSADGGDQSASTGSVIGKARNGDDYVTPERMLGDLGISF